MNHTTQTKNMNRREILQRLAVISGGMIIAPSALTALDHWKNPALALLPNAEKAPLLAEMADIIIPTTDTPGAKAAQVDQYILLMLKDCTPAAEVAKFWTGLQTFEDNFQRQYGSTFLAASADKRLEYLQKLDKGRDPFFVGFKGLAVAGYFTSEIGMTQAQAYLPLPGTYEADIPLKPGQKSWADYF
jgi:Gluconate 2-dehydrogenase subunit 3